jgi:hypothetical protein
MFCYDCDYRTANWRRNSTGLILLNGKMVELPRTLFNGAGKIDSFGFICTSVNNYQGYIVGTNL